MTSERVRTLLQDDDGVRAMVRCYAALNDWQDNIYQARRGVRACERIERIQNDGLIPLANEYFRVIAEHSGEQFTGDAEDLLIEWEDKYRFDYVEEADEIEFDEYGIALRRFLVDPECRFAQFAHDASATVNKATIAAYDRDDISDAEQDKFKEIWSDWANRMTDLFWERRYRLSNQMTVEISENRLDNAQKRWNDLEEKYPEFPIDATIGGEEYLHYARNNDNNE